MVHFGFQQNGFVLPEAPAVVRQRQRPVEVQSDVEAPETLPTVVPAPKKDVFQSLRQVGKKTSGKRHLTPREQAAIEVGQQQWFPHSSGYDTTIPEMMSSPAKGAVVGGVGGGLAGGLLGWLFHGLNNPVERLSQTFDRTTSHWVQKAIPVATEELEAAARTKPLFIAIPLAIGAGLFALTTWSGRKNTNNDLQASMPYLREGANIFDLEKSPVWREHQRREALQAQQNNNMMMTYLFLDSMNRRR